MITIIDYGMGNIASVKKALNFLNAEVVVSAEPEVIRTAKTLILPGVGSFKKAMDNLRQNNLITLIRREVLENKKPIFGICLGMQLLASKGYEDGLSTGLDLIQGKVRKLEVQHSPIPHIGWNNIEILVGTYFQDITDDNFYFVHSYHFETVAQEDVIATVEYEKKVTAAVGKNNIFGTQFHPEKSQASGLTVLKNFLEIHA